MRGVFEHNERDVLSLVALAICLGRLLSGEYDSKQLEAEELFRLGNWLERLGETEKAEKVFSRLIARDDAGMERYWMPLALKYKREGKWDQALALWKRSAARRGTFSSGAVNALIELAKYYEHQQKDFETALTHALEAKARWEARPLFREHGEEYRKRMMEMEHRIARLRRKVQLKKLFRLETNTCQHEANSSSPSSSNGTCSWQRPCSTGEQERAMDENRGSCQHPQRFSCGCTHSASDRSPGISIFSKNPRSLSFKWPDLNDARAANAFCHQHGIESVAHAPYPTNPAVHDPARREMVVQSLLNDLIIAEACGSIGVVVHFGYHHTTVDRLQGYKYMIRCLNHVLAQWDGKAQLLIENEAGGHGPMGTRIEELSADSQSGRASGTDRLLF